MQADKGRKKRGASDKGDCQRGREHALQCIYCANKRLCLGYK